MSAVNDDYSLRDVGRLLGLPRSIIRGLIAAGFVSPLRGRRREYRFSFQDLIVLRTARALVQANLPTTRILRSLRRLRARLPPKLPLSGLRVEAVGDAVVVREGNAQWQSDDGQYVLRFHVDPTAGALAFIDAPPRRLPVSGDELFERALALEQTNAAVACGLYRESIVANPSNIAAYANLGRVLHEQKQFSEAEAAYREGLARCGHDEMLFFNLAVLLEALARPDEAADLYRAALAENPELADAHYNLALLCESAGLQQEAIRHLSAFRRLRGKH